jgi:GMP synthase-like glutamine amidotransferase
MKPVAIFRHIDCEGPGYIATLLQQANIPARLIAIDQDQALPASANEFSGLICMGGSMSVNDNLPWIDKELDLVRQAASNQLPVLGICLGSQLICKALGSRVYPGDNGMELGWQPVTKATNNDWTRELPAQFDVFHWHGETFDLPAGAELLLQSACYPHQAFALDNMLALQFHAEMQGDMVREWVGLYTRDIENSSNCGQSAEYMLQDLEARVHALQAIGDILIGHWISRLQNR